MPSMISNPLVMVEVIPLTNISLEETATSRDGDRKQQNYPLIISTTSAKLQLINMSRQGMFSKGWLDTEEVNPASQKKKRKKKKRGNHKDNIVEDTDAKKHNEKNSIQSRGLRLNPIHQQKCIVCQNKPDKSTNSNSITDRILQHHNYNNNLGNKTIISGDLIFHGKNVDTPPTTTEEYSSTSILPTTYLQSDDPLDDKGVPCYLRGYIFIPNKQSPVLLENECGYCQKTHYCRITSGTVVQICHSIDASVIYTNEDSTNNNLLHTVLSGRIKSNVLDDVLTTHHHTKAEASVPRQYSKLSCYNTETVESLSLRMSTMLANNVWVGTTQHALTERRRQQQEVKTMDMELQAFCETHPHLKSFTTSNVQSEKSNTVVPLLLREGALLVYNSNPNSGKTTLVETIAKEKLKCHAVVISAPSLFAKYGTSADAALEILLHELVLKCAIKGGASGGGEVAKVCIILDQLETFLALSRHTGGDPYLPVLNAMTAYLNRLSHSLKTRNEFPFPNNPLYHINAGNSEEPGFCIPLGVCLIGVATCFESTKPGSTFQSALDSIGGGRFCVPLPSTAQRVLAFKHAFEVCGVKLTEDAHQILPEIVSSLTWASGRAFLDIAMKLRSQLKGTGVHLASESDVKNAMKRDKGQSKSNPTTPISVSTSLPASKTVRFSSVGGNKDAKLALEDALALDPMKRLLLSKFGLALPSGVLLYGPPGTGKTLLAKAVALQLNQTDEIGVINTGGAFVSLKASDIVRPEVGNSEKLIVSAFETARHNSPSVIFIDEFQALFGDREGGSFVLGQLASTLLQCMDDINRWAESTNAGSLNVNDSATDTKTNSRIVVLAATNTPWMIDKAFLRPGRFDRAVHVGLPTVDESEEILCVHVSQMKIAQTADGSNPVDTICKSIAKLCLGFSGADLAAICRAAAVRCVADEEGGKDGITEQHFQDAYMHDVKRSSNDALVKKISRWRPP